MSGIQHDDLRQETQRQLVESLTRDLDRAVSLIQDAERHGEWGGEAGYQRLFQHARNVLKMLRSLEEIVINDEAWATLHARAVELERLMSELPE